jgi:integrase
MKTTEKGITQIVVNDRLVYRVQMQRGKHRVSQLCGTLKEALLIKEEWDTRGLPSTRPARPPRDETPATVDDGWRQYELWLRGRNKDARRGAHDPRQRIRQHWPEYADQMISAVTPDDTIEVRRRLERAGFKPNTIVRDQRAHRAMIKKVRPGFQFPAEAFPPEDLTRVRMLTPEQYTAVFDDMALRSGPRFARMAELATLGIMRQHDVITLTRTMVRLGERLILLPRTKGGAPRAVPLSDQAIAILQAQLADSPHEYIFADPRTGRPYSRGHVYRAWNRSARACGLGDFTFHDLRHHGPTVLANHGANELMLEAVGGWSAKTGGRMVRRYAHILAPTIAAQMERIAASGRRPS